MRGRREITALGYGLRAAAKTRLGRGDTGSHTFARQLPFESRLGATWPDSFSGVGDFLTSHGLRHGAGLLGGLYIPPQPGLRQLFGEVTDLYPADAAYELVVESSNTTAADQGFDAVLAGSVLHARGVGVRVYDRVDFVHTHMRLAGYILQHVGEPADDASRRPVIEKVGDMIRAGEVAPSRADWHAPERFRFVDEAAGSAAETNRPVYVGLDSFRVPDQRELVRRVLDDGRRDLHFGLEYLLRGRRYLYQSVPTVGAGGRRDSAKRWSYLSTLLRDAGTDVTGRLVLDIGCNAGMMLSAALANGASWGLGWDRPEVALRARALLFALGNTRFDVFGAELNEAYDLLGDVPQHLHAKLDGSVVLYLAIRHHVGFLRDLASFPWRALVYEGGETETQESVERSLASLRDRVDFEIAHIAHFRDSETGARPVAVLLRSSGRSSPS